MVMISCTNTKKNNTVTPSVSFSKDIVPIFTTSCAINSSCHSGSKNTGDNVDLDSSAAYSSIAAKQLVMVSNPAASLLYVEISSGIMPKAPNSPLSASQISLVLTWIKQGAQNN